MRLSLLTVLAYLDDTLDPTQTRLVGQQVADSVAARDLVDRVQMLLRDRQIGVPAASDRLDPNLVAAFLDGKLATERAAEVEEAVLASDAALAEVAACHQVVASFRAKPETVPLAPRQRMYDLVRGPAGTPRPRGADTGNSPMPSRAVGDGLRVRTRRRLSLAFVLVPLAGALLLMIVAGVVLVQMWSHATNAVVQQETPHETSSTEHPAASPKESASPSKPPETTSNPKPPDPEPVKPPPDDPKVREPVRPPEPTRIDVPVIPKPSDEKRDLGTFAGAPATIPALLVQRSEAGPWRRIPKDGKVPSATPLVVLPGYTSDLRLDSGVSFSLRTSLPELAIEFPVLETVLTLHAPEPPFDLDCTVETGRLVIANNKPVGEVQVRLRFAKEIWDLTLKDAQSTAAFEVLGLYDRGVPFSKEPNSLGPSTTCNLIVVQGQVDLKVRYQSFSLPAPSLCRWKDTEGRFGGARKLQQLPRWFTDPALPKNQFGRDYTLALEDIATQANKKAVEVVLLEARTERKPIPRELALLAAAALDDLGALADALADEKDRDGRYIATFALRRWCGRNAENVVKLYKFLYEKKGYSKAQAEMILELFAMPVESLDDPDTWDKLIGRLRHDKLAIRHLSHWQLCQFVPDGQKIPYNASDGTEARDKAYELWKKLIPDGKVPPKPGGKR